MNTLDAVPDLKTVALNIVTTKLTVSQKLAVPCIYGSIDQNS
jgi:hypothetical protein